MGEHWSKRQEDASGEDIVTSRAIQAVKSGNAVQVKRYCDNVDFPVWKQMYEGTSLLHLAVLYQQLECVRILLECQTQSSDANVAVKKWNAPLVEVLRKPDGDLKTVEEILKLLLKHKADINVRTFVNRTILLKSLVCRNYDISLLLLRYGADPNMCDNDGLRPIHVCASYDEMKLLDEVIASGGDINGQDNRGRTALYFAILGGHENIFNELLARGCNPNIGSKTRLPLQTAIVKCMPKFVECLLKHGVFVNAEIKEYRQHYSNMEDYLNLALLVFYVQYDSYRLRDGGKQMLDNFIGSLNILDLITQAVCVRNHFYKNPFFRSCWLPLKLPEFLPYNHILRRIVTRLSLMHEMNDGSKLQTLLPVVDAEADTRSLKMICIKRIRQIICCTTNVIHAVEKLDLPDVLKNGLLLKDL